ncbi:MAG: hypothetical protein K2L70_07750 [Clostridia bacterium]|nr:hypothetical protein [Clostridia bacterium]
MKKLFKLSFIILIPVVLGIALVRIGVSVGNPQISKVGELLLSLGVPITMFALIIIGLVLMITGKLNNNGEHSENDAVSEAEREVNEIKDVNSSYGYESQIKQGEYFMRQTANNYKNATPLSKVLGWVFFGFIFGDFALIFVFLHFKQIIGVIICAFIFGATILISLIITKTLERRSIKAKVDISKSQMLCGEVKACLMSSATSTSGSRRNSTTRITGVTYRVLIDAEGKTYTAFSKKFYETGEPVVFAVIGKYSASIVDNDKFMQESESLLNKDNNNDSF